MRQDDRAGPVIKLQRACVRYCASFAVIQDPEKLYIYSCFIFPSETLRTEFQSAFQWKYFLYNFLLLFRDLKLLNFSTHEKKI